MLLEKDEYVEQRFFFKTFLERLDDGYSSQEILRAMKSEVLSTVKLPMAIDYLLAEIKLRGTMSGAMAVMKHYFSPFQTFVVKESETEGGRFDFKTALRILERLAGYMAGEPTPQGVFFYQLETVSRNRLGYDESLGAIAADPMYDGQWAHWINVILRRQLGSVDLAALIYVRSAYYRERTGDDPDEKVLFGEREGRIGWASALGLSKGAPSAAHSRRGEPGSDAQTADRAPRKPRDAPRRAAQRGNQPGAVLHQRGRQINK